MKKSIILFGGLLFLTTQSCDVLDKEPLDSISHNNTLQMPMHRH